MYIKVKVTAAKLNETEMSDTANLHIDLAWNCIWVMSNRGQGQGHWTLLIYKNDFQSVTTDRNKISDIESSCRHLAWDCIRGMSVQGHGHCC